MGARGRRPQKLKAYVTSQGGGNRSGKVWVCDAGPPDPLPPPVHKFMKNIPPSI